MVVVGSSMSKIITNSEFVILFNYYTYDEAFTTKLKVLANSKNIILFYYYT